VRVVFAGTPPFAATALAALHRAGHEIVLVLTQPDRPAGRGLRLTASAVAQAADERGLRVEKPLSLKDAQAQALVSDSRADVMVVAAYGLLLPPSVLAIPARGCINIHASLLPRWRGAAPIQRALLAGDPVTGITIMQMDAGLDTGPMLLRKELAVEGRATTGSLTEALASLGAAAICEALDHLDRLTPEPQDDTRATYAAKISKAEARIDWRQPAAQIDRQVRAFDPAPGAEAQLAGASLKVWAAQPVEGRGRPGQVLAVDESGVTVACGSGALHLTRLQKPGGRKLAAGEFLRGTPLAPGALLE
jgi:methionyl-tRNA formyltransferase